MNELVQIVGQRLRNYRVQKGVTQEQLAETAGVHPTYIGQLERGEKNATIDSLAKVTTALQVPLSQLLEGISPSETEENYPLQCYDMVQGLPVEKQKKVYEMLQLLAEFSAI